MSNCLLTKLKAFVDNSNLPILETMQQFTLDAITASGNNSMTDEQKWALNHFFYQIGAIDNSGIFSKLELLSLPFIGGTKNGALTDFAKNIVAVNISGNVTFANGGFVASANDTNIADYYLGTAHDENFFGFVAGAKAALPRIVLPATLGGNNITYFLQLDSSYIEIDRTPYNTYSRLIYSSISSVENVVGGTININDGVGSTYVFNSDKVTELPATYNASEDGGEVYRVVPRANIISNTPYAYAFGAGVTKAEQLVFTEAIRVLMNAFI